MRSPAEAPDGTLARTERVDAIVTGDRDLLDAGLEELQILTPRQLLDMLAEAAVQRASPG